MSDRQWLPIVDIFILFLIFLLSNLRALVFYPLLSGTAWTQIGLWLFTALLVVLILKRTKRVNDYLALWRANWPLGLFLALAFISIFWSLYSYATLFRALELLFATLVASYIGMKFRPGQFSSHLFWFGAILLILSLQIVFVFPNAGLMFQYPYDGAWRGLYWHKNHLGSIVALLNIVFLVRIIVALENRRREVILDGFFYFLSFIVLYFTKSATGYILTIVLHFFVACAWIWLKASGYLQKWHYYVILGVFVAGMVLVLSNLDVVFGMFNRSPTMTGRVELWNYLWKNAISQHIWWGHGFGAVWSIESFRIAAKQGAGWAYRPVISDNGYLDILLHVGIVGLLMFLSVLILATKRSFQYASSQRKWISFLPLLMMLYAFWANVALSLFTETEVFVWSLIVISLFMTTQSTN